MSAKTYSIAVLTGDGIGPEVVGAAITVLERVGPLHGVAFDFQQIDAGAGRYRRTGESISDSAIQSIGGMDAVLLGAMGLPDVRKPDGTEVAPQIDLREHFGLFAGLRPAKLYKGVPGPLRSASIDLLLIRESTEGMFAGRHDKIEPSDTSVSDRMTITRATSEKLFTLAFQQARLRRERGTPGHVTLVDKANVLRSNAFMRKIFDEVAARNPDIPTDRLYVDAASMMFVTRPERFDVVVTENLFGDITSEIAAGVIGGLGVAPSADLSETHGVFQPSHGSAPDIAGQGVANPVATILSAALMLDWLGRRHGDPACMNAADAVNNATAQVLERGPRTRDIGGAASTIEVTTAIAAALA